MALTSRHVEAMTSVDCAWLEMDEPHNPMVASAIFELVGKASAAVVGKTISQRLLRYERFRQYPDGKERPTSWIEDEPPDLAYHVHVRRLTSVDFDAQLRAAIAGELTKELDRFRPLWRVVLFPRRGGRTTVLFRAHHALADGIALMHLLLSCTDDAVDEVAATPASTAEVPSGPLGPLIHRLEVANTFLDLLRRTALDQLQQPQLLLNTLNEGRHMAGCVSRLLRLPEDNPKKLRRPLRGQRAVAWIKELPFEHFRAAALAHDVKINDLFMAWVAGAFGRYLRQLNPDLPETQNLRVSVPVNLRSDAGVGLGNCFGLVLLDLPVGERDAGRRLHTVAQRMRALKDSGEARTVLLGLAAVGHLPLALEKKLVNQIAGKAAAVVSNLRGPDHVLKFAGSEMRNMVFWPPQAGGIGVGLSLFSYAGKVSIGVSADTGLIRNPQRLVDAFKDNLDEQMALLVPPRPPAAV